METEVKKQSKNRSRLYPRYDLEDSIQFIGTISKLGGNRVSNEAVAAQVGKATNNSTFIGRVSSSKQFGLITQESGKLSLSSVGKEIVLPRGDSEKQEAIKTAFATPALYRELIAGFNGKVIDRNTLGNRLAHDYGIEVSAKDGAARNFIHSAEYAGLMQNGILVIDVATPTEEIASHTDGSVVIEKKEDPFNFFGTNAKLESQKSFGFNDSGDGWVLSIKSGKPLNSAARKMLVDLTELLEETQKKTNDD